MDCQGPCGKAPFARDQGTHNGMGDLNVPVKLNPAPISICSVKILLLDHDDISFPSDLLVFPQPSWHAFTRRVHPVLTDTWHPSAPLSALGRQLKISLAIARPSCLSNGSRSLDDRLQNLKSQLWIIQSPKTHLPIFLSFFKPTKCVR
jgi:hypothetical protein